MHVGTVFFSLGFYVFSDSARPVTFSPPSWISLTFTYAVSMHPRQNILEYWPMNPNIPEDTIAFMISTMPDVITHQKRFLVNRFRRCFEPVHCFWTGSWVNCTSQMMPETVHTVLCNVNRFKQRLFGKPLFWTGSQVLNRFMKCAPIRWQIAPVKWYFEPVQTFEPVQNSGFQKRCCLKRFELHNTTWTVSDINWLVQFTHEPVQKQWTGSKTVNRFKTPSEPVHQKSFLVCKAIVKLFDRVYSCA
jgi:hypothetical protein